MWKDFESQFSPRQYMISKDFELYYYNDVNLTKIELHEHDYYEFYFFMEGDICCQIGEESFQILPGDLMLIPPHTPHQAYIQYHGSHYRRFVLWISKDFYQYLSHLSEDYRYLIEYAEQQKQYIFHHDTITFNALKSRLIHILEEMNTDRFGRQAQITLTLSELMLTLCRITYEAHHPVTEHGKQSLCENVLRYIEEHLEDDLSLDQLSKVFFVSKYHISHLFKETFGLSLHQYVLKKRLDKCRQQIVSSQSITDTCQQNGFHDYSSFYRAFVKEYGISPKEYLADQYKQIQESEAKSQ